jgi:integrase
MFEYATDDADYLEKNPYRVKIHKKKVLPNRKKENEETIFFSNEEKAIIADLKKQSYLKEEDTSIQAIRLCFETGLRVGELLSLRERDIKKRSGNFCVHVQRQQVEIADVTDVKNAITKVGYEIVEYAKSDSSIRYVPLSEVALQIIDEVQRINKEHHKPFEDYLFLKNGNVMPPTETDNAINRACRHCKIRVRRLHSIRKTYASKLYANGVDVPTISKMLGHADEETTRRHYIFSLQTKDESYDNVLKALEKSRKSQKATKGNQKVIPLQSKKKVG